MGDSKSLAIAGLGYKVKINAHATIILDDIERDSIEDHIDIADVLIRWKRGLPVWGPPDDDLPPRQSDFQGNPIMQEIMKYISPEYWSETDALIREFDLEITGITKNIN